jgi:hypothetical protein
MATTYLDRTPGSAGNRKTWTLSGWYKRSANAADYFLSAGESGVSQLSQIIFEGDDYLNVSFYSSGSVLEGHLETNRKFRDPAAWYHIVIAMDTTQAVAADRLKIYVNGVQETSFKTETYPAADYEPSINNNVAQNIGRRTGTAAYFNGSMAHVHFIDGLAYAPTVFGETDATSGIWIAKTSPSVTYGTNGYFLKFQDAAAYGDDSSGNTNDFAVGAGTMTQTKDTPDNNFCTWNPTNKSHNQTYTFENGNTVALIPSASGWAGTSGTLAASAGKWYMEGKVNYTPGAVNTTCGFASDRAIACKTAYGQLGYVDKGALADYAPSFGVYDNGALLYATTSANNQSTASWATAWVSGDIVMFAVDIDAGKFYHGKNGTWDTGASNNPAAGTGGYTFTPGGFLYTPITTIYQGRLEMNFGNGYFGTTVISSAGTSSSGDDAIWEHDCPTGFYGLNTKNIKLYG